MGGILLPHYALMLRLTQILMLGVPLNQDSDLEALTHCQYHKISRLVLGLSQSLEELSFFQESVVLFATECCSEMRFGPDDSFQQAY